MTLERWRADVFALCWRQHGGSGLAIDWSSAMELLVEDQRALLDAIGERRAAEAKAIKDGGSKTP